jgi:hypothetical protein
MPMIQILVALSLVAVGFAGARSVSAAECSRTAGCNIIIVGPQNPLSMSPGDSAILRAGQGEAAPNGEHQSPSVAGSDERRDVERREEERRRNIRSAEARRSGAAVRTEPSAPMTFGTGDTTASGGTPAPVMSDRTTRFIRHREQAFSTGRSAPFTTGNLGPFTTGSLAPFTSLPSASDARGDFDSSAADRTHSAARQQHHGHP